MTMSQELFKATLEIGVKRRMPITWGPFSCLETIDAETVVVVIAASAEGNYLHMTRFLMSGFDEDASEIGNDGDNENRRFGRITNDKDVYIYKLRVERANKKRQVYIRQNSRMCLLRLGLILTQEHRDTTFGTMMQIEKIDYMQGNLKTLINRLKYATGREEETNRRISVSADLPVKCEGLSSSSSS